MVTSALIPVLLLKLVVFSFYKTFPWTGRVKDQKTEQRNLLCRVRSNKMPIELGFNLDITWHSFMNRIKKICIWLLLLTHKFVSRYSSEIFANLFRKSENFTY